MKFNYEIDDISYQKLSEEAYNDHEKGDKIQNNKWQVLEVVNVKDNGMQAIAVAPIKPNGKIDTSKITIAYRGTQPFGLDGDLSTDVKNVFGGSKKGTAYKDFSDPNSRNGKLLDHYGSQFDSALAFANKIQKKYKGANIDYTGHSLGAALGSHSAHELKGVAVVFAAPNTYRLLSDDAKKTFDRNRVHNFVFGNDAVGNFGQFGAKLSFVKHTLPGDKGHSLTNFAALYVDGKLIYKGSENLCVVNDLNAINKLKKQWAKQGNLTPNQAIFIDQSEALSVLSNSLQAYIVGSEEIIKVYDDAIIEADKLWKKTLSSGRSLGVTLSESEILEALSSGGATQGNILTDAKNQYEDKINTMTNTVESYGQLISQLTESIDSILAKDQGIADFINSYEYIQKE